MTVFCRLSYSGSHPDRGTWIQTCGNDSLSKPSALSDLESPIRFTACSCPAQQNMTAISWY